MDGYEELWALEDQLMSRAEVLGRLVAGDRKAWRKQKALRRELRAQDAARRAKAEQLLLEVGRRYGRDAEHQARFNARIACELYTNGGTVKRPIPWDVFAEEAREKVIERRQGSSTP